jgi:hypothetical protein
MTPVHADLSFWVTRLLEENVCAEVEDCPMFDVDYQIQVALSDEGPFPPAGAMAALTADSDLRAAVLRAPPPRTA